MRHLLLFLLVGLVVFPSYVYGDSAGVLGSKLIPEKIMENTEGILQVYSMTDGILINKIIATSSDPSVIQVVSVESDQAHSVYDVKIKALTPGDAKIALASPGFSSQEVPITVYKNSQAPTQILIKTTPDKFATDHQMHGYVTVELANSGGIPTIATSDYNIKITTTDNKIINLSEDQLVIKKGSYYAMGEFDAKQSGTAKISASSPLFQPASSTVTVNNVVSQKTIQVYVYPQKINALHAAYSYAIVQLQDSSGNPVVATEDIPVKAQITNSTSTDAINTSGEQPLVQMNDALVIKKGSYWGYAPMEVSAGIASTFNVQISAKGYLVSAPAVLNTTATNAVLDDKTANMDMLPVLATGQKELLGVLHLQDSQGNPVIAKDGLSFHVDSSDPNSLSVDNIKMDYGSQAALVFGETSTSPNPVALNLMTDTPQTITPTISIPTTIASSITAEPMVPAVLSHTTFPLAVYLTSNGAASTFANNFDLLVSPKDSIQVASNSISKGQEVFVTDATLLKDGDQRFSVTTPDLSNTFTIKGMSPKPSGILLEHPDQLVSNAKNLFSIELLDEQQNPVQADTDTTMQLVSSDPSVLSVPDTVKVNKGSYYATFDANTKNSGSAEISVLTDKIPLSKFDMSVTSFVPSITIDSTNFINPNAKFEATLDATYKGTPLSGLDVAWTVNGATIQDKNTITDDNGKATITLVSSDPKSVNVQAAVSGGSFETTTVTKQVKVNPPLQPSASPSTDAGKSSENSFSIMGINPFLLVIPVAAGVAILVLKKKDMLEGITEKISFAEAFSGLRDRLSESRPR